MGDIFVQVATSLPWSIGGVVLGALAMYYYREREDARAAAKADREAQQHEREGFREARAGFADAKEHLKTALEASGKLNATVLAHQDIVLKEKEALVVQHRRDLAAYEEKHSREKSELVVRHQEEVEDYEASLKEAQIMILQEGERRVQLLESVSAWQALTDKTFFLIQLGQAANKLASTLAIDRQSAILDVLGSRYLELAERFREQNDVDIDTAIGWLNTRDVRAANIQNLESLRDSLDLFTMAARSSAEQSRIGSFWGRVMAEAEQSMPISVQLSAALRELASEGLTFRPGECESLVDEATEGRTSAQRLND
jgi:hypothetical protein